MPNKTEGCICTSTTGLSMPPLCPQHANASRQELLRQLAEQGEKLKAAEALASAAMLGKSAAEHRVSALCTERDGLKARLGRMTEEQDNMLEGLAGYEHQVKALEQKIAGAKVCSHIYTRVALTSTTNCPACTNGIVWPPKPAESKGVNE